MVNQISAWDILIIGTTLLRQLPEEFAVCFVEHDFFLFHETDIMGIPVIFAEFVIATAAVIVI